MLVSASIHALVLFNCDHVLASEDAKARILLWLLLRDIHVKMLHTSRISCGVHILSKVEEAMMSSL